MGGKSEGGCMMSVGMRLPHEPPCWEEGPDMGVPNYSYYKGGGVWPSYHFKGEVSRKMSVAVW